MDLRVVPDEYDLLSASADLFWEEDKILKWRRGWLSFLDTIHFERNPRVQLTVATATYLSLIVPIIARL